MRQPPLGVLLMSSFVRWHSVMAFVPRRFLLLHRRQGIHHLVPSDTEELSVATSSSTLPFIREAKVTEKNVWVLQFDGGSRGNPGRAGSGSVIYKSDLVSNDGQNGEKCVLSESEEMWTGYHYLGEHVTNNVAEYSGLIEGLKQAVSMKITSLLIQGDSQLILNQVEGKYKVKNENLKPLHAEATTLLRSIPKHILEYIPRAQNARADELSNMAMDSMEQSSVMSLININIPEVITDIQVDLAVKVEEDDLITSTPNSPPIVCTTPIGFQGDGEGEDKREGESVIDLAEEKEEGKDNALSIFTVQVHCSSIVLNYEEQTMTVTVPFSDIKYNETKHTATELFPTISLLVDSTKMKTIENIVKTKKPKLLTEDTNILGEMKITEKDKKKLEKLLSSSVKNATPKISKVVKVTGAEAVTIGEVVVEVKVKGRKGGSSEERNIIGMTA